MELLLKRKFFSKVSIIGELSVEGKFECFILEGLLTRIPAGKCEVVITNSPRFSQLAGHPVDLPLLVGVPGHIGIRIHPGNTAADTTGCLLPGITAAQDKVLESRVAFDALFLKIKAALDNDEKVFITIEA